MARKEEDPLVPWGYAPPTKNKPDKFGRIRLSQIPNSPLFKALDPAFAANVLRMITENPSIGISESGRTEGGVKSTFYQRYAPTNEKLDVNDPKVYKAFSEGKYKEFEGKIYKLKKGMSAAATPGASYHSRGFAFDMAGNRALAGKIVKNYNINQVLSTNEDWHFQPVGSPDGFRVIKFLRDNYGYDLVNKPLPKNALDYINKNFASNAPSHPDHVLDNIEKLLKVGRYGVGGKKGKRYGPSGTLPPAKSVPANGRFSPHSNIMPPRLGGY
jgi:hypothetical protein